MPHLTLSLLGGFQALLDDHPLDGFQSDKARGLLVYLAVEADRGHSRAKLAGLFWADLPEKRALTYLRHPLANLRKVLGDADPDAQSTQPFLLATPQTLQFNRQSDHRLDVLDLLTALVRPPANPTSSQLAALEAALDGNDHPFLEGFFLKDAPAFDEWAAMTRERCQRRALAGLQTLTDACAGEGDYTRAAAFARRGVDLAPWQEESHRQLMRLLALSGQRSAALAQYEVCRSLLRQELDVAPGEETTALYRAILAGDFDAPAPPTPSSAAAAPQKETPHNLPTPLTPLVGRAEAVDALQQLFSEEAARLVTLTGPGGVGKTRLALAAAWEMLATFPHGVYFVELAPVQDEGFVLSALANGVGVDKSQSDRPLLDQIVAHFQGKTALLVLDNFEHILAAAPTIARLLAALPHLKALATSRVRLRLAGEFVFVVPPLTLPEGGKEGDDRSSALELFRQRAKAAHHRFVLDRTARPLVVALCARLDGLPLAIELAAARLRYNSLSHLLSSFTGDGTGRSLTFLQTDLQDAPERHRSLWTTIAWSYGLLSEAEQTLLRRLSLFVSGWTGEAAGAVCEEELTLPVAEGMRRLVDAHLIHLLPDGVDGPRYGMLETIREFGLAQLQSTGELRASQQRHALYFREWAKRVGPQFRSATRDYALSHLIAEQPNLQSALRWATAQGEVDIALSLCESLFNFWVDWARHDALGLIEPALALAEGGPPSVSYAHVLTGAGYFHFVLSRQAVARSYFEAALAMNDRIGRQASGFMMGIAYGLLTRCQLYAGDYAAAAATQEATIAHAYGSGDEWNLAITLANLGLERTYQGQEERGKAMVVEGLALFRRIGDLWGIGLALQRLGEVCRILGEPERAREALLEADKLSHQSQVALHSHSVQRELALISLQTGDASEAVQRARVAHSVALESKTPDVLVEWFETLAQMAEYAGVYDASLALMSFLIRYNQTKGSERLPWKISQQDALMTRARQRLSQQAAEQSWQLGAGMTIEQVADFAEDVIRRIDESARL